MSRIYVQNTSKLCQRSFICHVLPVSISTLVEGGLGLEPVQHYVAVSLPPKQCEPEISKSMKHIFLKVSEKQRVSIDSDEHLLQGILFFLLLPPLLLKLVAMSSKRFSRGV